MVVKGGVLVVFIMLIGLGKLMLNGLEYILWFGVVKMIVYLVICSKNVDEFCD